MGGTGGTAVSFKLAVAVLAMGIASGPALAQPGLAAPVSAPQERPQTTRRSYGLQIFAADGLLAAVALGTGRAEPILGLALTGPIIHAVHGRGGAAVGSLFLRVTVPFAGVWIGASTCGEDDTEDSFSCFDNTLLGFGIGAAVAFSVDYFVLGRETVDTGRVRLQPAVSVTRTASTAGVRLDF
jgi:hypothetical protein